MVNEGNSSLFLFMRRNQNHIDNYRYDAYNNIDKYQYQKKGIQFIMKTMMIFEPAMCCATGLCGVGVDPELLRISTILEALHKKGINVIRYNLSSAPMEFIQRSYIQSELSIHGVDILPLTVVDDQIKISSRYPSNAEILALLEMNQTILKGPANINITLSESDIESAAMQKRNGNELF